ncbi:MAG: phosphate ABC transporter substrate-binding protein [Planctomycetes bacterium]|nr:phosphate ABC transporter substrate-binding protein [Planctomycetota bacterium]
MSVPPARPAHDVFHAVRALVVVLVALVCQVPGTAQVRITIKGSNTMLALNRELADRYHREHPDTRFVVEGLGSESGIHALLRGETDVAAVSRPLHTGELAEFERVLGGPPREIVIGRDGVGVYVHESNPVSSLTLDQLAAILAGDVRNWKDLGGPDRSIEIVNRNEKSGTRGYLQERVLGGRPYAREAHDVASAAVATATVAREPGAIGYAGIAFSRGAKIIRISTDDDDPGIWPSHENVANGSYPLSRSLHFYVHPESDFPEVQAFLEWVVSPKGQAVVSLFGYFPDSIDDTAVADAVASQPHHEPGPRRGVIELTPQNMRDYDLPLVVAFASTDVPERKSVIVSFGAAEHALEALRRMTLRIGEHTEIPIQLDDEASFHFEIGKEHLANAKLVLTERGAPTDAAIFEVPLARFARR